MFSLLLSCFSFISQSVYADSLLPTDMNITLKADFDRGNPPARFVVWDGSASGYDDIPGIRTRDWFTCKSATDTATGACSRQWVWAGNYLVSSLKMRFIEKRSRVAVDIPLNGQNASCYYYSSISCSIWTAANESYQRIQDGHYIRNTNSKKLYIYFNADDLAKIPTGGVWEGTLILEQRQWSPANIKAHWTANITLDVTDRNNGAIYLPAFGKADALVDLNLQTKPLSTAPGGEVSGTTVIDTCLYDGYNSNNAWLQVTLSDQLPANGRASDIFSVTKTGTTGGSARDRVDYRIAMDYNGAPVAMENGKVRTLSGVNTALIRPVALSGFSVPVVCTPAPLTLTVQPFAKASKTAGRYSGVLRVKLAARTLAP